MALALVLGEAGTPPERLATSASCVLDEVQGAPRITEVALTVRARVEALDEAAFKGAVDKACGVRKLDSCDVQAARAAQLADETELTLR